MGKSLPPSALGQVMRGLREDQKLPQEALARRAGITPSTVSFIECRVVDPRWTTIERLGRALGVSMAEIGRRVVKQEAAGEDRSSNRGGRRGR
jgi:transcriptional regulator with XRE-family HTH domain